MHQPESLTPGRHVEDGSRPVTRCRPQQRAVGAEGNGLHQIFLQQLDAITSARVEHEGPVDTSLQRATHLERRPRNTRYEVAAPRTTSWPEPTSKMRAEPSVDPVTRPVLSAPNASAFTESS